MKPPITDCAESRVHLTRLPGLADPVLQFDLPKEIEQLRTKGVLGEGSRTEFRNSGQATGFSCRSHFDEGRHTNGRTQGRRQDFDPHSTGTNLCSSAGPETGTARRTSVSAGLRITPRRRSVGGERVPVDYFMAEGLCVRLWLSATDYR
jgi:hypothetical protein